MSLRLQSGMFTRSSTTHLVRTASTAPANQEEGLDGGDDEVVLAHTYSTPVLLIGKAQPALEGFSRGLLYVNLFCARNIRGDEYLGRGKADPYVKISYGIRGMQASLFSETHEVDFHQVVKTLHSNQARVVMKEAVSVEPEVESNQTSSDQLYAPTADAGSEPVWNHKFAFPILHPETKGRHLLELEIYNRNGITRKDNKLGSISIAHLSMYVTSKPAYITDEMWFPVFSKKHKERGEILMSFYFQAQGDHKFADGWEIPNRLNIGAPAGLDREPAKLRKFDEKIDGPLPPGAVATPPPGVPELMIILE